MIPVPTDICKLMVVTRLDLVRYIGDRFVAFAALKVLH